MNSESTDRTFIDSSQDVPRIMYRSNQVLTTSSTEGSYKGGFVTFSLNQIKANANTLIEMFMKDNQTSRVYNLPVLTVNSSTQYDLNAYWYAGSESTEVGTGTFVDIQYVTCNVYKRGGATTDTYNIYIVVYSTKVNENMRQGSA